MQQETKTAVSYRRHTASFLVVYIVISILLSVFVPVFGSWSTQEIQQPQQQQPQQQQPQQQQPQQQQQQHQQSTAFPLIRAESTTANVIRHVVEQQFLEGRLSPIERSIFEKHILEGRYTPMEITQICDWNVTSREKEIVLKRILERKLIEDLMEGPLSPLEKQVLNKLQKVEIKNFEDRDNHFGTEQFGFNPISNFSNSNTEILRRRRFLDSSLQGRLGAMYGPRMMVPINERRWIGGMLTPTEDQMMNGRASSFGYSHMTPMGGDIPPLTPTIEDQMMNDRVSSFGYSHMTPLIIHNERRWMGGGGMLTPIEQQMLNGRQSSHFGYVSSPFDYDRMGSMNERQWMEGRMTPFDQQMVNGRISPFVSPYINNRSTIEQLTSAAAAAAAAADDKEGFLEKEMLGEHIIERTFPSHRNIERSGEVERIIPLSRYGERITNTPERNVERIDIITDRI